jgi:GNAT superfamily N-acetyltransferase
MVREAIPTTIYHYVYNCQKEAVMSVFLALRNFTKTLTLYIWQYLEGFGPAMWNNDSKGKGNIREEFVTGDRKGTSVFQRELNNGSLAVLSDDTQYAKEDLFIREEFRGRGIGTWALKQPFQHYTLRVCPNKLI